MLAAVFFIIIMSIGASAIGFQGDALGHNYETNETLNADSASFAAGEVVNTTNSHIEDAVYDDDDQITVNDENGVEMVEGVDYEWNENNGSVTILTDGDLTDDASLDIEYGFNVPTAQQQDVLTLTGAQVGIGQALMWVFGAILAIAILRMLVGAG